MPDPEVLEWAQKNKEMIQKFVGCWDRIYNEETLEGKEKSSEIVDSQMVQYVKIEPSKGFELGGFIPFRFNQNIDFFQIGYHLKTDIERIFDPLYRLYIECFSLKYVDGEKKEVMIVFQKEEDVREFLTKLKNFQNIYFKFSFSAANMEKIYPIIVEFNNCQFSSLPDDFFDKQIEYIQNYKDDPRRSQIMTKETRPSLPRPIKWIPETCSFCKRNTKIDCMYILSCLHAICKICMKTVFKKTASAVLKCGDRKYQICETKCPECNTWVRFNMDIA